MSIFTKIINPLALHDKVFKYSFLGAAPLINIFGFALVFWKIFPIRNARSVFALHYNIYFGIDLIGAWWKFFLVPSAVLAIWAVNLVIASAAYRDHRNLSYFATGITLLLELLSFLALLLIVLSNI